MNYFYDLPNNIINKILDRKVKLERIDELKICIKWEKEQLKELEERNNEIQECDYDDLKCYEEELDGIEGDIMIEDLDFDL